MPKGAYDHWKIRGQGPSSLKDKSYEEIYGDRAEEQRVKRNHPVTKQALVNMKEAQNRPEVKAKKSAGLTGITRSKATRAKMGASKRGDKNPSKRPEVREKNRAAHLLENLSEETKAKMRKPRPSMQGENNPAKRPEVRIKIKTKGIERWQDPEYREKQIKATLSGSRVSPNKLEEFLSGVLQNLFLDQWKFVGNGKLTVGGRCPDFVHVNQKKIIEFNGDYWHGEEFTGRTKEEEEQQRIDCFTQYGYQTLVIWEHELKDSDKLIGRLLKFNGE